MADELRYQMRLFKEALAEQREFMENFAQDTNQRLDFLGTDLIRIGEETRRLGEETRRLGEETRRLGEETQRTGALTRQSAAESSERYNQLFGRMRLTEGRLDKMLGAVDHDRAELRELYHDLERRVSEVERRLPHSAA